MDFKCEASQRLFVTALQIFAANFQNLEIQVFCVLCLQGIANQTQTEVPKMKCVQSFAQQTKPMFLFFPCSSKKPHKMPNAGSLIMALKQAEV